MDVEGASGLALLSDSTVTVQGAIHSEVPLFIYAGGQMEFFDSIYAPMIYLYSAGPDIGEGDVAVLEDLPVGLGDVILPEPSSAILFLIGVLAVTGRAIVRGRSAP